MHPHLPVLARGWAIMLTEVSNAIRAPARTLLMSLLVFYSTSLSYLCTIACQSRGRDSTCLLPSIFIPVLCTAGLQESQRAGVLILVDKRSLSLPCSAWERAGTNVDGHKDFPGRPSKITVSAFTLSPSRPFAVIRFIRPLSQLPSKERRGGVKEAEK